MFSLLLISGLEAISGNHFHCRRQLQTCSDVSQKPNLFTSLLCLSLYLSANTPSYTFLSSCGLHRFLFVPVSPNNKPLERGGATAEPAQCVEYIQTSRSILMEHACWLMPTHALNRQHLCWFRAYPFPFSPPAEPFLVSSHQKIHLSHCWVTGAGWILSLLTRFLNPSQRAEPSLAGKTCIADISMIFFFSPLRLYQHLHFSGG